MSKLLYFVWTKVDADAEKDWIEYMDKKHLADVLETNFFISARRLKVTDGEAPANNVVIFEAESKEKFDQYVKTKAAELRKDHVDHFGSKVSSSRIILEEAFFLEK